MSYFALNLALDFFLIAIPIAYYIYKKKDFRKELGLFSSGVKSDAKKTILLFCTLLVFSFLISFFTQISGINDLQKVSSTIDEIKAISPLVLAYLLVARVISEEIFFRGFLVKHAGPLFSSILFGLAHFAYGSTVEVAGAMVLGYILAKAIEQNKTILPNIVAHFLYNAIFLLLVV